jgi:hypothetical protein
MLVVIVVILNFDIISTWSVILLKYNIRYNVGVADLHYIKAEQLLMYTHSLLFNGL